MNWLLIVLLSGFGLIMGIATISVIPSDVEPLFWIVIFIFCAIMIAVRVPQRFFLHGVALGVANSVWITALHVMFFETYLANHQQEAAMSASMPMGDHPRVLMAVMGPIIGVISGVVIGVLAIVAAKVLRRRPATRTA